MKRRKMYFYIDVYGKDDICGPEWQKEGFFRFLRGKRSQKFGLFYILYGHCLSGRAEYGGGIWGGGCANGKAITFLVQLWGKEGGDINGFPQKKESENAFSLFSLPPYDIRSSPPFPQPFSRLNTWPPPFVPPSSPQREGPQIKKYFQEGELGSVRPPDP